MFLFSFLFSFSFFFFFFGGGGGGVMKLLFVGGGGGGYYLCLLHKMMFSSDLLFDWLGDWFYVIRLTSMYLYSFCIIYNNWLIYLYIIYFCCSIQHVPMHFTIILWLCEGDMYLMKTPDCMIKTSLLSVWTRTNYIYMFKYYTVEPLLTDRTGKREVHFLSFEALPPPPPFFFNFLSSDHSLNFSV